MLFGPSRWEACLKLGVPWVDKSLMLSGAVFRRSHVYRSAGTRWAAVGSTGGAVVFLIVGLTGGRGQVAGMVIAALLLALAWRMSMVGIQVGDGGVRVVTLFLARRALWNDIDHFAVLPLGRFPYVGYVVMRDGRKFGTFGLSTSSRKTDQNRLQIQRPIDELNRVLANRRDVAASQVD
jgi:hypothetical protein